MKITANSIPGMKELYKSLVYLAKRTQFSISIFMVMLIFAFVGYQIMKINMLKNAQNLGDNLSQTYSLEQKSNLEFYSVLLSYGVTMVDNSTEKGRYYGKDDVLLHAGPESAGRGDGGPVPRYEGLHRGA